MKELIDKLSDRIQGLRQSVIEYKNEYSLKGFYFSPGGIIDVTISSPSGESM